MSDNLNAGVFPRRIEIELSAVCNLRCSYCPRKFLKELDGFMEFGLVKQIIDEAAEFPETILVLHRRGESLLHPRFGDICELVKGKFKEVQLATNATLLDDKKSI
ncbi:MAG: radical SAM protein, partial [Candidatus Omnitrophica bacterium]|nr:radical SAM protein [Candidatus Omnitrophota bacterium]